MPPGDRPDRPRRVFLTGVFDMANFGDLLFPIVAADRLGAHGIDIVPVSPTGRSPGVAGALPSVGVDAMLGGAEPVDGIVVGGGYVVHNRGMDFLDEYGDGAADWAGAGLWLGAGLAAALRDVPVAWNAPGVPHPFAAQHRPLVAAALAATDYLALRDRAAAELLPVPDDVPVAVVPDTIAALAETWPARALAPAFARLVARKGIAPDTPLLAVHIRNRSIAGLGPAGIARLIDDFAPAHGLHPVLVAVGRSHQDDVVARLVAAEMRLRHTVLEDPLGLDELAALMAHARLYVGASLHGYIVAAAYGVAGILVGRPAYRKFQGFVEQTGRLDDLAGDWPDAFRRAGARAAGPAVEMLPAPVGAAIGRHWHRIAEAIGRPEARRAERAAFLRATVAAGIRRDGPGWALAPYRGRPSMLPAGARPAPDTAWAREVEAT